MQPAAHHAAHATHHHHCPLSDDLFGGQLDLDDDCLRLLLGEDADEAAGPCTSAAGSGKGPAGTGSGSGASQRSSATAGEAAAAAGGSGATHPAAAAAAEGEAVSLPAGSAAAAAAAMVAAIKEEEEEDIAMLFGEYHRWVLPVRRAWTEWGGRVRAGRGGAISRLAQACSANLCGRAQLRVPRVLQKEMHYRAQTT